MQIAFTTRSGTNQFDSSIYHYFRHPELNSNYYFNKINGLEKNEVIVAPVRRPVGRPDRDSRALRRPQQGVLSSSTSSTSTSRAGDAHADDPEPGCAAGHLQLH